jgi:hypothetical protein
LDSEIEGLADIKCKVDPENPATSCKTCGIVQTSSAVDLESILSTVSSKAAKFDHHPLILPVYMFNHHYSETEKLLKKMVKVVDGAEQSLLSEIQKQKGKSSFMQAGNDALIDISNDLHETSMDLARLNLRRSFETGVAEQLEQQLPKKSELLTRFNGFDLGSKRNTSTIDGMATRIESLKTLVSLPRLAGLCQMPSLANDDISETFACSYHCSSSHYHLPCYFGLRYYF